MAGTPNRNLNRYMKYELGIPRDERRRILRSANRATFRSMRVFGKDGLFFLALIAGLVAARLYAEVWLRRSGIDVPDIVLGGVVGGLAGGVGGLWVSRRARPIVFAELRARGHNVCQRCGYSRAGIEGADPCPECGTPSAPLSAH
jgi:hypothetical protein